jgi:hypothetical protein
MPLSDPVKTKRDLYKLRPRIDSVKWRMDVKNIEGKWKLPAVHASSQTGTAATNRRIPKATVARHAEKTRKRNLERDDEGRLPKQRKH